jgi:hypothetical protein
MSRTQFVALGGLILCLGWVAGTGVRSQQRTEPPPDPVHQQLRNLGESVGFAAETQTRASDDLMLFQRLADLAEVDKVRFTGPPPRVIKNPTAQGAGNPIILSA